MKLVCLAAVLLVGTAAAQDSAATRSICLKPQPAPRCHVVFLTNLGLSAVANAAAPGSAFRVVADWGVLANIGDHEAFGATFIVSGDRDGLLAGPMVRYRRWISDTVSIEFGVGMSVTRPVYDTYASVFGLAKWNISPTVGFALRPELRTTNDFNCVNTPAPRLICGTSSRSTFAVSAGIELSGAPGLILSGAAAAAGGILAALLSSVSD